VTTLASALLAGALVLTGCGGGDSGTSAEPSGSGSATAKKSDVKVGLAYDIGGRGDQSFNDAAAAGLDKAKSELGIEAKEAEAAQGESEQAKEERLRALADSGFNPIVAVGFAYSASVAKVAKDMPDVQFAIIDDAAAVGPNVANLLFAENEGSFLVGAAAALKSTAGNVGFVGGVDVPLIHKFEAGFKAGAEAAKPGIKVQSKYLTQPPDFSGFGDPAKGKTAAEGMFDAGADVVYHAAGGSGGGVFEAAKAANKLAIGVDSDQFQTADPAVKDVILTSMLKKVDVAVFDFVKSVVDKQFKAGSTIYNLEKGGVDYSASGGKVDDIKSKLDEYKQKIISGEIKVPEK
jgi:basic membrane protein A